LDEYCDDFLPWLEQKAGAKISSVLSIGKSAHGRFFFRRMPCLFSIANALVAYQIEKELQLKQY
jgi:hypothetical protein